MISRDTVLQQHRNRIVRALGMNAQCTRLCAHRDYRLPGQGGALDKLVCGLFEHALALGLRHMSTCIAGLVTVDHGTLEGFYRTAGITGPVLNYVGIPKPSVDLPGEHVERPASLH